MDIQSMLLGFLMRHSMTGYEMRKTFSVSFSFFSDLSYGSIYPTLSRMKKQGLITMQLEIQDGAPNRKVYTITEAGRKAFVEALRAPLSPDRIKCVFLMRLFFFAYLSPEERKALGQSYLKSVQTLHQQLEYAHPQIEAHADRFQYLCFEFGLRFFRDLAQNVSQTVQAMEEHDARHQPPRTRH